MCIKSKKKIVERYYYLTFQSSYSFNCLVDRARVEGDYEYDHEAFLGDDLSDEFTDLRFRLSGMTCLPIYVILV